MTELMQLWIEAEVLRLTNIRAVAAALGGHARTRGIGGQDAFAEHNKTIYLVRAST